MEVADTSRIFASATSSSTHFECLDSPPNSTESAGTVGSDEGSSIGVETNAEYGVTGDETSPLCRRALEQYPSSSSEEP